MALRHRHFSLLNHIFRGPKYFGKKQPGAGAGVPDKKMIPFHKPFYVGEVFGLSAGAKVSGLYNDDIYILLYY
jgi:hypothetical protein